MPFRSSPKVMELMASSMPTIDRPSPRVLGPIVWAAKHTYTGCDPVWHANWELTIPNYGCSCRKDYAEYKADNPPDFSSPHAYWLWGVQLHNWVNRKLGKSELTVEEAKAIWRREYGLDDEQTTEERR